MAMHEILLCTVFFSALHFGLSALCALFLLLEEDEFALLWSLGSRFTLCSRMAVQPLALWCDCGGSVQASARLWSSTIWLSLHTMSVYRHELPHGVLSAPDSPISSELPSHPQECILRTPRNGALMYNLSFKAILSVALHILCCAVSMFYYKTNIT